MDSPTLAPGDRPAAGPLATWAALLVVYVVWGSTYLGIRVVVRYLPPLLAMGARFFVAGLLLLAILAIRYGPGVLRVPPRRALAAGAVGVLLLTGGNGAVAVAEQAVPSGLAALFVSAIPLWLVCLRLLGGDRPRLATIGGTLLGFAGIAELALPGSHPAGTAWWGVATIIGASLSWACGSFASQRLPVPSQPFVATTYEMLAAGTVLLVAGAAAGEGGQVHLAAVPGQAWLALGYLVVVGSLAAFSAYVWLLGNAPLSLTATYAYVNPVVAVVLGALILAEPVTGPMLAGGLIVVAGVALVVSVERPGRPPRPRRANRQRLARPDPRPAPDHLSSAVRERAGD
ncbi:MAG: EamA family transporter [Actinobacteria bacterium]|nr:EamA family transporter [Actinomycetota bacterium]